jgi:hypothetical protein
MISLFRLNISEKFPSTLKPAQNFLSVYKLQRSLPQVWIIMIVLGTIMIVLGTVSLKNISSTFGAYIRKKIK